MLPKLLADKSPSDPCRIRVLAVSYEGRVSVPDGTDGTDHFLLVENLISELIYSGRCHGPDGVGAGEVPVFLVGHDLGGLIIKEFVMAVEKQDDSIGRLRQEEEDDLKEKEKRQNFLSNLSAIFFYATPHNGSEAIEDLAKGVPEDSRNRMLALLSVLGSDMSRINADFSLYRSGRGVGSDVRFKTYAIVAQNPTSQKGCGKTMLVPEASARFDMDNFYSVSADHFEVCQPKGTWSAALTELGEAIYEHVSQIRSSK
ncbi:hypothetical protein MPTK1_4g07980 [Marchantia polymorpha subsp. ruderalis]|nr:hypothetical protein MARPO_0120s0044 [Marchantia polymorpha]BBN08002.1 hypothetical protein Mp_4g07980 [Marchantia polymorpha subsp. ruderalis]|eukprot:PTQ30769.1 hypothetical protein MARPO_0120s0044 [Marchantia polymorpha]